MNVLITGSGGFLGRALAERLVRAGHGVVPAGRDRIGPIEAMTAANWRPLLAGVDAVIHAAAIAHIGPNVPEERYKAVNRNASGVLAQAAAMAGVRRFVFISSIRAQVGPTSPVLQSEATPPAPTEPYGQSKLAAEALITEAFPAAIHLRPPLIVGGEARANLALLARLAASRIPLPFGGCTAPQAVVARDNLMDAIELALVSDSLTGRTWVLADDPHPSLADMLRWLREGRGRSAGLLDVPLPLLRLPAALIGKADAFDRIAGGLKVDSSRIRAEGWSPRASIAEVFRALGASGG